MATTNIRELAVERGGVGETRNIFGPRAASGLRAQKMENTKKSPMCQKTEQIVLLNDVFGARSYACEDRRKQERVLMMEIRFKLEKEMKGALGRYQKE
jgi:hypothetical protein